MAKSIEELQVENLDLLEEVRVLKETKAVDDNRIKELERANTSLYNKVVVQHDKVKDNNVDNEEEEIPSFDDFIAHKLNK